MNDRAYTYIDRSRAVVGNRWMERTWSAFLGNTTSLLQKAGEFEWLERKGPEFRVVTDEGPLEVLDFGETAWSEENSPRGGTLVSVQSRPGIEITLRTTALHDHPAFVRTVSVLNTGGEPLTVREFLPERLPLRRDGLQVYTEDFSSGAVSADWHATQPAAALALGDRGLFFGSRGGGHFRLFADEDGECAVRIAGPRRLEPGQTWRLEPTFLIPYTGWLQEAATTLYSQFLLRYLSVEECDANRGR